MHEFMSPVPAESRIDLLIEDPCLRTTEFGHRSGGREPGFVPGHGARVDIHRDHFRSFWRRLDVYANGGWEPLTRAGNSGVGCTRKIVSDDQGLDHSRPTGRPVRSPGPPTSG